MNETQPTFLRFSKCYRNFNQIKAKIETTKIDDDRDYDEYDVWSCHMIHNEQWGHCSLHKSWGLSMG